MVGYTRPKKKERERKRERKEKKKGRYVICFQKVGLREGDLWHPKGNREEGTSGARGAIVRKRGRTETYE